MAFLYCHLFRKYFIFCEIISEVSAYNDKSRMPQNASFPIKRQKMRCIYKGMCRIKQASPQIRQTSVFVIIFGCAGIF